LIGKDAQYSNQDNKVSKVKTEKQRYDKQCCKREHYHIKCRIQTLSVQQDKKSEKSLFNVTQVFIKNKLIHINEILAQRYDEFAEIHENPELVTKHRLQV